MKRTAFAIALLLSGAAFAQTTTTTTTTPEVDVDADVGVQADGDLDIDADVDLDSKTTTTTTSHTGHKTATGTTHSATMHSTASAQPASGMVVQPGNNNPEEDARGIAVISAPAVVPAGWNNTSGTGMGGPLLDASTGKSIGAEASYPACSASVTDNCVQAYERGRRGR